jgi:hypothetical protein
MAKDIQEHLLKLQEAVTEGRITSEVYESLKSDLLRRADVGRSGRVLGTPYDDIAQVPLSPGHMTCCVIYGAVFASFQAILLWLFLVIVSLGIEFIVLFPLGCSRTWVIVVRCIICVVGAILTIGCFSEMIEESVWEARTKKYDRGWQPNDVDNAADPASHRHDA